MKKESISEYLGFSNEEIRTILVKEFFEKGEFEEYPEFKLKINPLKNKQIETVN